MKKLLVLLLTVLMCFALAACSSAPASSDTAPADETPVVDDNPYNLVEPGKLTVSMSTDYAPMEFFDTTKTGQDMYVGSDVELCKFIADYLGLELVIKAQDFDTCQVSVAQGIADMSVSGYSYTTSRAAAYLLSVDYFSDGDSGQVAIIKAGNSDKFPNLDALNVAGVTVAAQNGALQQEIVTEQLPNATMMQVDDLNNACDQLYEGTYDAVAIAQTTAELLVQSHPDKFEIVNGLFDDSKYTGYHALINLENTALCDAVNEAIGAVPAGQYATWQADSEALFLSLGEAAVEGIVAEAE
ncbi:MAG: transporter substrate-binding domain-containing protein [Erysipelotrichaceae bacterium]|nr:transporter substrate-binding domain-containing protein [Erysipelotrichaceae bacterium]